MTRVRLLALGLAWVAAGAACEGHRTALERDRLLLALDEQKAGGRSGPALDLMAVLIPGLGEPASPRQAPPPAWSENDPEALQAHLQAAPTGAADALGRCLLAHAWAVPRGVVAACGQALDRFAADPDMDVAALILSHWHDRAGATGHDPTRWWPAQCRGHDVACARRRWAVDGLSATSALPKVASARVTGPFDGDAAFAAARLAAQEPLPERPLRTHSFVTEAVSGRLVPARHDEPGWYRIEAALDVARPGPVALGVAFRGPLVWGGASPRRVRFGGEGPARRVFWFSPTSPGVHRLTLHVQVRRVDQPLEVVVLSGDAAPVPLAPTPRGALPLDEERPAVPPGEPVRVWADMVRARFGADRPVDAVYDAWGQLPAAWVDAPAGRALIVDALEPLVRLPRDQRDRIRDAVLAPLVARWPQHIPAGLAAAHRAEDEERFGDARALIDGLIAAHPQEHWLRRHRVPLALAVQDWDVARADAGLLSGADAAPEDLAAAAEVAETVGDLAGYARLTERRLQGQAARGGDAWLARRYARGDDGAEAAVEAARGQDPGGVADDLWLQRHELTDPAGAAARLADLAARFPNEPAFLVRRAALTGVPEPTLDKRFAGHEEVFFAGALPPDVNAAVNDLRARIEAHRSAEAQPFADEDVVFVDDTVQRTVHADGSAHVVRTYAVALQSRAAVDAFGEIAVGGAERVLALYVVQPDGTVREPERAPGVTDVTLTGLGQGDVVAFASVRLEPRVPWPFPAFEVRSLQGPGAALRRRHALRWPAEGPALQPVGGNNVPAPERPADAGHRAVQWEVTDQPALPGEPFAPADPADVPYAGFVLRHSDEAWAALRAQGRDTSSRPNAFLARLAQWVIATHGGDSPAAALREFVLDHVTPAPDHHDAVATLWSRSGDRLAALAGLCRAAGLAVTPLAFDLPARSGPYDPQRYAVPGIQVGDDDAQVVVGTRSLSPFGHLPRWMAGAVRLDLSPVVGERGFFARLLLPDDERREELPADVVEDEPVSTQIALDRDAAGHWQGAARISVPPAEAGVVQEALAGASADALREVFTRWLAVGYPAVQVDEVRFSARVPGGESLAVGVSFHLGGAAEAEDLVLRDALPGLASVLLQLSVGPGAYLTPPVRARSLVRQPLREVQELQVVVEPQETFVEVPQPVEVELDGLLLEHRVEVTDGRLSVVREVEVSAGVATAASWGQLRDAWAAAWRALNAPLRVVAARHQTAQYDPEAPAGGEEGS